jgi:hypothetical protein
VKVGDKDLPEVRLTFAGGGWILVPAGILLLALLTWAFAGVIAGHRPQGGSTLESYGFDLATTLVPKAELVPTGQPRDMIRPLDASGTMAGSAMAAFNSEHRKKYVVTNDRVIGVVLNGEARAYPLSVAEAHEAIHDTLGGVPILVAFSPLCDAAAVYDRRVGQRTMTFGWSGLVRNANTLFYDRTEGNNTPSLWQQIDGRAIAGPAAARGERLAPVGLVSIDTWGDWLAAHPETTVLARNEELVELYKVISYDRELATPSLAFPVSPMPPADALPLKSRVLVLEANGERKVVSLPANVSTAHPPLSVEVGGVSLRLSVGPVDGTCGIDSQQIDGLRVVPCCWFIAYASLGCRPADVVGW